MKSLTYYIDKCIMAVYVACLIGGVFACTESEVAADENLKSVNMRYVNTRFVASRDEMDHMSADDFLSGTEKPADKEGIAEYIESLKRNGIDNRSSDKEDVPSYDEEEPAAEPEVSEDNTDDSVEIDKDDWRLMLVNKQNPVPDGFEPKLCAINGSLYADERIIGDIYRMMDAASDDGVNLMICSAYRSFDRQKSLFDNKINKLMGDGMTYLEAYRIGSMNVTVPGTSEHHIGLALDILTGSYTSMDDGFGETKAGKWLAKNASDYGFILRYPEGKEDITGIVYEPWHFRYVGVKYAKDITKRGVCLEEYLKDR